MANSVPKTLPKPSPHRRCLLQLSKSLEQHQIDELLYLSEDFIPQTESKTIQSGIDFMRCLEKHGRLAPGQYDYLTSCLDEIGRNDLAQKLDSVSSLVVPQALYLRHRSILEKQKQFLQEKRELYQLSRDTRFWDVWTRDTHQKLSIQLETIEARLQHPVAKSAHNTNQTLKAAAKLVFGAIQNSNTFIAELEGREDNLPLLTTRHDHQLDRLSEDLSAALNISPLRSIAPSTETEPIQRLKDKHPLSVVSTKLFGSLSDLLKEVCGEAEAKKQLRDLEDSLVAFKSLLHTNAHLCFGFLSLVHLTDTVASSDAEILDQEAKEIITSLVHGFPKGAILTVVEHVLPALKGTSVLTALKEDKEMQILFADQPPPLLCPCKANKSLRFGLLTVLLTLYKSAKLTTSEWREIQSQIMQQFRVGLSEPNYNPFLEIDMIVMNSLEQLFKHFSSSTLPTLNGMSDQLRHFSHFPL